MSTPFKPNRQMSVDDVIVYRPDDVVVGKLRLRGKSLGHAIATEEILRLDDVLIQSGLAEGVRSLPSVDVARDSIVAVGCINHSGIGRRGHVVEAGRYLVHASRRHGRSLMGSKIVEFGGATVAYRAGDVWRQEHVAPLYLVATHETRIRRADRAEFEAATAIRRVSSGSGSRLGFSDRDRTRSSARDPYWGLDGETVRTARRNGRIMRTLVVALSSTILALLLVQLRTVDAPALLHGPARPIAFGGLGADAISAVLVLIDQIRRRRALSGYAR